MNKLSSYIPSLIASVLLVLTIICSSASALVTAAVNSRNAFAIAEEKNLGDLVQEQLTKYYYKKYNSSGIPAEVYSVTTDYIIQCEKECIEQGFYALEYCENPDIHLPENKVLEERIINFFDEYATKEGYEKDENFTRKIDDTTKNAYASIRSYSDVYKISALAEHKVLLRLSRLYKYRSLLTIASVSFGILLILLLILINRKNKISVLYWTGISSLIAGLAGSIPSMMLISNRYYDSFSIKQPAVFLAYTGAMYKLTGIFMTISIIITVAAVLMLILYAVFYNKKQKNKSDK